MCSGDFSGGPVVKTLSFHCRGHRFDPCWGARIPHAVQCGQKNKKGSYCLFFVIVPYWNSIYSIYQLSVMLQLFLVVCHFLTLITVFYV